MNGNTRIGHVNLKVSNLNNSINFYTNVLEMKVTKLIPEQAAFLSHGDYHHDLCINTWFSKDGSEPVDGSTGLYHFAIVYGDRNIFLNLVKRLLSHNIVIDEVVDHNVTHSVYIKDPDNNGIEVYWDKPRLEWFDGDGKLFMRHKKISIDELFQYQLK